MVGFARSAALRTLRGLATARDRRFRSALRLDASGPVLLLSPHLDDAVLNCWSLLRSDPGVRVVNVFCGTPPSGMVGMWDRVMGASDSQARMRERVEEDRAALEAAGVAPALNLPHVDNQFRNGRPPASLAAIDATVVTALPSASRVFAPINLGVLQPDHRQTRAYALALHAAGFPVTLYADVPYCAEYGWPGWVTGDDPDPYLDIDAMWGNEAAGLPGAAGTRASARVERLSAEDAAAKLEAIRLYRSQLPTLDRGPIGLVSNPRIHGFEVFWDLA